MLKKRKEFPFSPDFKEQTPDMQIGEVSYERLYEEAFLSDDGRIEDEYTQNTATWD